MSQKPPELDKQVGGKHYKRMEIEPAYYNHVNRLGWLEGEAIKLVSRHRWKNGREDIEKAIHYLQMLLAWDYPLPAPEDSE